MPQGFSLIEILFVLFIFTILLCAASPDWAPFIQKEEVQIETHRLFHALQLAKSEAIKHNHIVLICGTQDFNQCSTDWSKGYMIMFGEQKSHIENRGSKITIHSKNRIGFYFNGQGQCTTPGTLYIGQDNKQHRIILAGSGRIRIEDKPK